MITAKILLYAFARIRIYEPTLQLYMKSTTQMDSLNSMFPTDHEYNVTISEQR